MLFDRFTLRQWVTEATAIAVVEFESDVLMWTAPDGSDRQEYFRVRVLDVLAGSIEPGALEFFPHAEGFPQFRNNDRALLFLERTADRNEFATLAPRFAWHSAQAAGQEWQLPPAGEGDAIVEVARRLVALRTSRPPDFRRALREHLVTELASSAPRLRRDALVELMRMDRESGFLDAETTTVLARFSEPPALPPLERLALIRLLDSAPGFDTDARLLVMTQEPLTDRESRELVRSAGLRSSPALRRWIATLAEDPRPDVQREARAALATTNVAGAR